MKQQQIWIALVIDRAVVLFNKAFQSKGRAKNAIVGYLRKNTDFDGDDINDACCWVGEKDLHLEFMVFAMHPEDFSEVRDRLALFRSDLPLMEKGLYRVIYEIDVGAASALQAAKQVHDIMSDPNSMPPVFDIIDNRRNKIRIDLSHCKKKG